VRDAGTVPCNNDLLAANFIDDGEKIWLIDYEYSGNNDPCFELGNIWGECGLSADALAALVGEYYGKFLRNKVARAQILGLVGKYGWTLWGAIQHASSPIEFDFWGWGMERFEAAAAVMTSPSWGRLLDEAVRVD
jgi:thiamine kinase-like enzyme